MELHRWMRRAVNGIALGAWVMTCGCPPQGDSGGRVSVHEVTPGERASGQMHTGDLASASDGVAQQLAGDVGRIVEEEAQGLRATVTFGDIMNKSGAIPTTDFEYVRQRIRNKLMQSRHVYNNVRFVEMKRRVEDLNAREYGGQEDPLQEGGQGGGVERTDPRYSFYLNGNVYGVHRGGTHLYSVTFELTRANDGAIVFSKDYEVKYR